MARQRRPVLNATSGSTLQNPMFVGTSGVRTVFGIPGTHTVPFYHALEAHKNATLR